MPQNRLMIALIGSVIVGLFAIIFSAIWLKGTQSKNAIGVIAAAKPIAIGQEISADDLKVIQVPRESVPIGAFQAREPLLGRMTKVNIGADQVIVDPMLNLLGGTGSLAYAITKGKRAITLNVNEISDVAGFVMPGNYVDVLMNTKNSKDQAGSKILLEKILVLAVAQERLLQGETKAKVVNAVTLEVTPAQAEAIDSARSVGSLSLILRNQADEELTGTAPANKETKTSRSTRSTEGGVQVIRGTAISIESGFKQ